MTNIRTNVVLDRDLVEDAKSLTGIKTTRGVIDEALHLLVRLRKQEQTRALRGKLYWEGNLETSRLSRFEPEGASHETSG